MSAAALPQAELNELEDIEIALLLEGLYRYYGFDFREYSPASLKRRILERARGKDRNRFALSDTCCTRAAWRDSSGTFRPRHFEVPIQLLSGLSPEWCHFEDLPNRQSLARWLLNGEEARVAILFG